MKKQKSPKTPEDIDVTATVLAEFKQDIIKEKKLETPTATPKQQRAKKERKVDTDTV